MDIEILEIRDAGTFIPVLCVNLNSDNAVQHWYMRRVGYPCDGEPNIGIVHLNANGDPFWNDPYGWGGGARTFPVAHDWIIRNWRQLSDGDVVCVETILGERETPKVSERLTEGEWTVRPAPSHLRGEPEPEDL